MCFLSCLCPCSLCQALPAAASTVCSSAGSTTFWKCTIWCVPLSLFAQLFTLMSLSSIKYGVNAKTKPNHLKNRCFCNFASSVPTFVPKHNLSFFGFATANSFAGYDRQKKITVYLWKNALSIVAGTSKIWGHCFQLINSNSALDHQTLYTSSH